MIFSEKDLLSIVGNQRVKTSKMGKILEKLAGISAFIFLGSVILAFLWDGNVPAFLIISLVLPVIVIGAFMAAGPFPLNYTMETTDVRLQSFSNNTLSFYSKNGRAVEIIGFTGMVKKNPNQQGSILRLHETIWKEGKKPTVELTVIIGKNSS